MSDKIIKSNGVDSSSVAVHIAYIRQDIQEIKTKLESDFMTRKEFEPYKKIIQGLVGVTLLAAISAVLKGIII
jgi:hypothetical protein